MASTPLERPHADLIAQALATKGGHLRVGRHGSTLFFSANAWLSTADTDKIKAECAEVGLPVIDTRPVSIKVLARLIMEGPEVQVGPQPPYPHWQNAYEPPWSAFSYAPLAHVIELYPVAGAEVLNWPPSAASSS